MSEHEERRAEEEKEPVEARGLGGGMAAVPAAVSPSETWTGHVMVNGVTYNSLSAAPKDERQPLELDNPIQAETGLRKSEEEERRKALDENRKEREENAPPEPQKVEKPEGQKETEEAARKQQEEALRSGTATGATPEDGKQKRK